jgi:hypothetical protein
MSLTAVRSLTVVSFFVIGGILICANLNAGTAPYVNIEYSQVINGWGTTFDDKPYVYNRGEYFATDPINNRDYGSMPQEDTTYIWELNAPFDMRRTSWSASTVDQETQSPLFQTYIPGSCSPTTEPGMIYAMNDTDHIYLALQVGADDINREDRIFLYFDPDNITPVAEFVEGSGYCIGVKLGDIDFNAGAAPTVHDQMDSCNGHWMDWDNSGSIDVWEYGYPWPYVGATNARTYPVDTDTGDPDDLTICPRSATLWGDGGTAYPWSGAYQFDPATTGLPQNGFQPIWKTDMIMMEFKIPLEQLGCSIALGSDVGFAIRWFDDMDGGTSWGDGPYDEEIQDCTPEWEWWPTDIQRSGNPGAGWEKYDAAYMGTMTLSSLNIGNRLWGAWYDIKTDRTSYLVLKNVSDEIAKTKVKFYQSLHGDASERWAPLPGAGGLISASQCLEIPSHSVTTLQLEEVEDGILMDTKGCIEVTNIDLAGYLIAYVGLESGAIQRYAWSVDLETTPLSPEVWGTLNSVTTTGMMLTNKWYIVGEPGWDYNTSVVLVNPDPISSVTASVVLYPAKYWVPDVIPQTMNTCADTGFMPDFDGDYTGSGDCGDDTGDADDVINIPPHQAVELRMWEFLNTWVAGWNGQILDITDPDNDYWHFRKGTIEIYVQDGDDTEDAPDPEDRMDEVLLGITARESASHGWAENLQRFYE